MCCLVCTLPDASPSIFHWPALLLPVSHCVMRPSAHKDPGQTCAYAPSSASMSQFDWTATRLCANSHSLFQEMAHDPIWQPPAHGTFSKALPVHYCSNPAPVGPSNVPVPRSRWGAKAGTGTTVVMLNSSIAGIDWTHLEHLIELVSASAIMSKITWTS